MERSKIRFAAYGLMMTRRALEAEGTMNAMATTLQQPVTAAYDTDSRGQVHEWIS